MAGPGRSGRHPEWSSWTPGPTARSPRGARCTAGGSGSPPASVAMYRGALALTSGDLDATVAHAREARSLARPDDALIRAGAAALAGLASWSEGDLAAAHAAYTTSLGEMRRIGYIADVLGLCITLGDLRQTQGRLGE